MIRPAVPNVIRACGIFVGVFALFGAAAAQAPAVQGWALAPLIRPLPPVPHSPSPNDLGEIDRFIRARSQAQGLVSSPPADRATLLRRVTFDLHGLPPTPAELDAFLADRAPHAFAAVVDRLLASPRYGERWARHWLDVARFSESDGFEYDKMREQAWPYRDYLIQSFNADKPYARFVLEQIAGDTLEPVTRAGIAATGFLVAGPYDEAGNSSASALLKARVREEEMEDIIAAVAQSFLGMTVNCARCHDHKFDPIPQRDYYRLKAALDGVRHGTRPWQTADEAGARTAQVAALNARIHTLSTQTAALDQAVREQMLLGENSGPRPAGSAAAPPSPLARWTFDTDARDSGGSLHGTLLGGARIAGGRLLLDGKGAYVRTEPLSRDLREKTMEAWVVVSNLAQQGGGVLSIASREGGTFDALVFGERVSRKWMAGSSLFQRTRDLEVPDEAATPEEWVHVAVTYRADHRITLYRNGTIYGEGYTPSGPNSGLQTFPASEARVLIGLRHLGAGNGFFAGAIEEARLYDRALTAEEIAASARSLGTRFFTPDEVTRAMTARQRGERSQWLEEARGLREELKNLPAPPPVYAAVSRPPDPTYLLARGDVEQKKEIVTAGGLSALSLFPSDFALASDAPESRRRRKLAEWIVHHDNPLTWRVMVNRIWHYHFGRGLVGTPNDFGVNGERPSHPELLDWLAVWFRDEARGSLKQLHRLILTSATYQQASSPASRVSQPTATSEASRAQDPDNRLLTHFPLHRLEAEAVRDAMLSISGQLNLQPGGPGFRPFKVTVSGSHFYELIDSPGKEFNRRSVYRMSIQSGKDPLLDSLDCPDPSTKTPARSVTTTPIQSLGLMNNAFVQRQTRHLAERLRTEAGGKSAEQITLGYRLALSREPSRDELQEALELARRHGLESVGWVLLNASEFLYVR